MDRSSPRRSPIDAVFDAAGDGLAVIEHGTYDRVSETYADLLEYEDPDALEGRPWTEPFPEIQEDRLESEIRAVVENKQSWQGILDGVLANDSTSQVALSLEPFGEVGVVAAVRLATGESGGDEPRGEESGGPSEKAAPAGETITDDGRTAKTGLADVSDERWTVPGMNGHGPKQAVEAIDSDPADSVPKVDAPTATEECDRIHDRPFVKRVLDALDDVIYVVNEDGRFVLWNDRLVETTGYEPEALEPMDPTAFFAADQPHDLPEDWSAMTDLDDRRVELDVVTSDGETIPHEFHSATFEYDGRRYRAGIVRDVTDRRHRERALENSEERYRQLLETAPVPIGVVADGVVVYCNAAAVEFFGANEPGDVLGHSALEFVHEDDREMAAERLERVFEEGEVAKPIEERFRTLDGTSRTAEVATAPINYEGEPAAQIVFNDVSEYKATQQRLEASRERYRRLIEAAPVPIWVQGIEEIRFCNEAAVDFYGAADRESLVGRSDLNFVVPEERERSRERNRRILEDGEVMEGMEGSKVGLDGKTRHGLFSGAPIRYDGDNAILVIARDITKRKERERELERNKTIIETVVDGVYALDEDREFTFVNDALCDMLGRSREELLGTDVRELFLDEDLKRAAADMRERVVSGDLSKGTLDATAKTPDGERIDLEANYRLLGEAEEDEFPGSAGVIRDVTERNRREREIARQRDELERITHINDLVLDVIRSLVETSPGEDFETAICTQLAGDDPYQFAWIGHDAVDGTVVQPRVNDGIDETTVIDRLQTEDDPLEQLVTETLRTGSVRTDHDDEGLDMATIPIGHGTATDGVLCLGTDRAGEFGDREQEGLAVLGETIGFVRNALENRKLLVTDAVVELEFAVRDAKSPVVAAASETEATISLEGYVEADDGIWLLYLGVQEGASTTVAEALKGVESVASARVLTAEDDAGGHVEARVTGTCLPRTLLACGGSVRTGTATAGEARFVVEVPIGSDVRRVVERVTGKYPNATLLAQRERDGAVQPPGRISHLLEDELTDRQRSALRTAYHAGYFKWPRESTAEEVADAMDISSPTLHSHLRRGERKLLRTLFDDGA
ncbi:MAG: PAS domain S-box-containing protein [Halobacteriales archaeon]|jgi:PAS domain S-box-containing protein